MRNLYYLLALLLSLSLGLTGCPGGDDDDSAADDDDATPPDDDDDDSTPPTDDDDDSTPTGGFGDWTLLQFNWELTFIAPGEEPPADDDDDERDNHDDDDSAADDDDSAADDDDSAADDDDDSATTDDDDDSATTDDDDDDSADDDDDDSADDDDDSVDPDAWTVQAQFIFVYLDQDPATGQYALECVQRVEVDGVADFGFSVGSDNNCTNCTGMMNFDYETAIDVSNPGVNPNDCDPAIFEDKNVVDYGFAFLTPAGVEPGIIPQQDGTFTNYGDWLNLGVVTRATHETIGTDFCSGDPDCTAAGNQAAAEEDIGKTGVYAAALGVDGSEGSGTGASLLGLDAVTEYTGTASDYLYAGVLQRDSAENDYEDPVDLNGGYIGNAGFVLTRGAQ